MNQLVIFDLDGTLLYTIEDILNAVNKAILEMGINRQFNEEEMMTFVGSGVIELAKRALKVCGIEDNEKISELVNRYNAIYTKTCYCLTRPYNGVKELLKKLKNDGYLLVVFSNKPDVDTQKVIKYYFEEDTFDLVRGKLDGVLPKPSSEGVDLILKEFPQIEKNQIYYVGDSDVDMKTGLNSGLITIGVTYGYRPKEVIESYHPYAIVDSPAEVYETIANHK